MTIEMRAEKLAKVFRDKLNAIREAEIVLDDAYADAGIPFEGRAFTRNAFDSKRKQISEMLTICDDYLTACYWSRQKPNILHPTPFPTEKLEAAEKAFAELESSVIPTYAGQVILMRDEEEDA